MNLIFGRLGINYYFSYLSFNNCSIQGKFEFLSGHVMPMIQKKKQLIIPLFLEYMKVSALFRDFNFQTLFFFSGKLDLP